EPAEPPSPPAVPAVAEPGPRKKAQEKQARRALLEIVRQRWPQAFPRDLRQVKPLARRLPKDMSACLPERPATRIRSVIAIFQYVLAGPAYYRALLQGGPRYDLDGNPRGEVTAEEQEKAKQDLKAFYERRKERRKRLVAAKVEAAPEP